MKRVTGNSKSARVLAALTCKHCGKVGEHSLDCFIREMTLALLTEFGAGEFVMHAEGACVDQDSVRKAVEDACEPVRVEDYLTP